MFFNKHMKFPESGSVMLRSFRFWGSQYA